ncbi:MAG: hypothetical protein NXI25_14945 [bacterium]|nr:hypothetical protein [bacterium]
MRIANIFSIIFSVIILFTACKKKEAEPQCPECWDQKAVCVDAVCRCPEGTIVIDQTGMYWPGLPDSLQGTREQLLCVEPDSLTFLAEFDTIGCYRTLAVQFPFEPLRFDEEWTSPFAPIVEQAFPIGMRQGIISLTIEEKAEGVYVKIEDLMGSIGYVFTYACVDFRPTGEGIDSSIFGGMSADFEGYMVDENTIEGELILKASGSYEEEYDGRRKAITFVRTTAL